MPAEKSLKRTAEDKLKSNPSALGDPVSLKSETSDRNPTEDESGCNSNSTSPSDDKTSNLKASEHDLDQKPDKSKQSLKELAESNATMLGDPVSLKAETSDSEPTENDRGALRDGEAEKKRRESKL